MSAASRFGLNGERYGSTPILTRSGSSTDHHRHFIGPSSNYSLDRKSRSSCQSTSPPLSVKLINYDSLESVRKSPASAVGSTITNKSPQYRLGGGSLLDLTPSPSDSGVSELEAALRDRDSELAYLRQTMEHNEQVIFRVYQEKERVWERELRRMKSVHENRLRTSAQRALKLEQMLVMQTYQLQQDKKRLCGEAQRANCESERLRQEVVQLKGKLEETEWGLCQKTGEISLLKSQLKDFQNDQNSKGHELLQMRSDFRDVRHVLTSKDEEIAQLKNTARERDAQLELLREELKTLRLKVPLNSETRLRRSRISESTETLTQLNDFRTLSRAVSLSSCDGADPPPGLTAHSCLEADKLKQEIETKRRDFNDERLKWAQEKEKVLKYQRQLQMNYVQMYRRTKALEAQVQNLTVELGLEKSPRTIDL